jgi:DNA-directed RNA polymerase subunit L
LEIKVTKEGKNTVEFVITDERHTFPNLLRSALLKDGKVKFAAYKLHHPTDNQAQFALSTEGKTPRKALADALKRIEADLSDFKKEVKKSFK